MDALRQSDSLDWVLLWTDEQTAGRGRQGRVWQSRPGDSLCLSVGHRLLPGQQAQPALTVALGAAIANVLDRFQCPVRLKWPNDILLAGGKLGGILCEASSGVSPAVNPQGTATTLLVAGVGINLKPFGLSSDPPTPYGGASQANGPRVLQPASLLQAGVSVSASQLAGALAQAMVDVLQVADDAAALAQWCERAAALDAWRGQAIEIHQPGQPMSHALADGIEPDGTYRVRLADGTSSLLVTGELSIRGAS